MIERLEEAMNDMQIRISALELNTPNTQKELAESIIELAEGLEMVCRTLRVVEKDVETLKKDLNE